jgi:hypothetical protein
MKYSIETFDYLLTSQEDKIGKYKWAWCISAATDGECPIKYMESGWYYNSQESAQKEAEILLKRLNLEVEDDVELEGY